MRVLFEHERVALLHGDCAHLGELIHPCTVDSVITDPPAGIGFMQKGWDKDKGGRDQWVAWLAAALAPTYAALKPGGHALVWALPRTSHWTAWALELAGFEIRDRVSHLFGTGFPKSLTSNSAEIPEGSGTALKPALEDWWLVRKPLDGNVADNYKKWGTGVIWIDVCRIGGDSTIRQNHEAGYGLMHGQNPRGTRENVHGSESGRWPAHLTLDEEAAELLDEQSGELTSGSWKAEYTIKAKDKQPSKGAERDRTGYIFQGGKGGASRFFYVAKGARSEKDAGLDHLPKKSGGEATDREDGSAGVQNPRAGAGRTGGARNFHPTVKSVALMRWLCRLITPPGGIVLDPFAGSGSTGVAALAEGLNFIGCELTDEYLPILEGRIRHALGMPPA